MTAVNLEKRNRIIEFLSKTNDSKILDKVDKLISKVEMPELKPMTADELMMKIQEAEESLAKGNTISLAELKAKVSSWK